MTFFIELKKNLYIFKNDYFDLKTIINNNKKMFTEENQVMVKERTPNAYMFFLEQERDSIKKEHPKFKITEVAKEAGKRWRGLKEKQRFKFVKKAEEAKKKMQKWFLKK